MPGINEFYKLKPDDTPLLLKILIGRAGIGETSVYIDGIRQSGPHQDSFTLDLGPGSLLGGKVLETRTYAGKISPHTGKASITIGLHGGYEDRDYPMEDHSPDNPVVFAATFYLIL
jgi:hypothetical protein